MLTNQFVLICCAALLILGNAACASRTEGELTKSEQSELVHAIRYNDNETAAELLKRFSHPNTWDTGENSLIRNAVKAGNPDMVSELVARKENVNDMGDLQFSPLMDAVIFLEGHSNPALRKFSDWTTWHDSTGVVRRKRYSRIINILLDAGASPNIQDAKWRITPLHAAAQACDLETIRLLLDHNANTALRDYNNQTPFDLCSACPDTNIRRLLRPVSLK